MSGTDSSPATSVIDGLRVERHRRLDGVLAQEWDSLLQGSTIYSCSNWLRVRDEELPDDAVATRRIVRDERLGPVLSSEAYTFASVPHRLYSPSALLDEILAPAAAGALERLPMTVGTGWSEFRGQLPRRPGTPDALLAAALRALAADVAAEAAEREPGLLCYLFLPYEEAIGIAQAHAEDRPVVLMQDVENVLSTSWPTFEDYLQWLPRNRRTRVRRELKEFRVGGRAVRRHRLSEVAGTVAALNHNLMQKYGHDWFDRERAVRTYDRQGRHLSQFSSVLTAEDDGRAVAFALRYVWNRRLYSRVVGFDYTVPNHSEYFTLLLYEAVAEGAASGVDAIDLGLGTYEAKLGRGAQPRPLYGVFLRPGGERLPVDAAHERNRARARAFGEEFGHFVVGGVDTGAWVPEQV